MALYGCISPLFLCSKAEEAERIEESHKLLEVRLDSDSDSASKSDIILYRVTFSLTFILDSNARVT